jgi:hypothetical protein
MATYVVGYDIHPTKGETYGELIEALKKYDYWWHHLDSTWLIVTDDKASTIRDNLKQHMKSDDQLIVIKTCDVGAWYGFSDRGSKWLKDNI